MTYKWLLQPAHGDIDEDDGLTKTEILFMLAEELGFDLTPSPPKTGSEVRFCEFTGDATHRWDEVGWKKKCKHLGITDTCLLHQQPIGELDGWRVCCAACTKPIQTKEYKR